MMVWRYPSGCLKLPWNYSLKGIFLFGSFDGGVIAAYFTLPLPEGKNMMSNPTLN